MFVQGHGQKSEQKHRTKNFAKLPNHLPLLTMVPVYILKHTTSRLLLTEVKTILFSQDLIRLVNEDII